MTERPSRSRPGRRRAALAGLVALALIIAPAAYSVLHLTTGDVAARLAARWPAGGAYDVSGGMPRLALLPLPGVTFPQVQVTRADAGFVLRAGSAEITLDPWRLALGVVRPTRVTLSDVELVLPSRLGGSTTPRALAGDIARFVQAVSDGGLPADLPALSLERVSLRLADADGGPQERFALDALSLLARQSADPILIAGAGLRHAAGERVGTLSLTLPSREAIRAGRQAPVELALAGEKWSLGFTGEGVVAPEPRLKGQMTLASEMAAEGPVARLLLPASFSAAGSGDIDGRGLRLESLALTLGAQRFSGVASLLFEDQRWQLASTLDAERLDLGALLPDPLLDSEIALRGLFPPPLGVDLRLSSRLARLGRFSIEDAAISLLLRADRAEIGVNSGRYQKGAVKARLVAQPQAEGAEFRLNGSLERADAGAVLADIGVPRALSGTGSVLLQLESRAGTVSDILQKAEGRLSLALRHGELAGFDLDRALLPDAPANVSPQPERRTRFETLQSVLLLRQGEITVSEALLSAGRQQARASGAFDPDRGEIDLWVVPAASGSNTPPPKPQRLLGPVAPGGRWIEQIVGRRS